MQRPARSAGHPCDGAAAAWTEELYARHGRLVAGLCRALLRDRAEAEDAAQQTFLAAHRALVNGTSPQEPAAWLATIARNECWARIRLRMREPLPVEEIDAASHVDPLTEAIQRADLAALWRAVAELPRQQRDALLLREFGGLTYAELAEALAVTGPAVESLLFRARQGLRSRLETAYAAVSGASIVEALARLVAGASSSGAPVVAKAVAAAGVGAAVVTGGVVVAPHVLEHHRALVAPHVRPASTVPATRSVALTPAAGPPPVSTAAPAALRRGTGGAVLRFRRAAHGGSAGGDGARSADSGEDGHSSGSGGSGDEGRQAATTAGRRSAESDRGSSESTREPGDDGSDQGSDGGSGHDDGGASGSGGGDGGGGSSGDAAQDPSDGGGGVTVPLPNPPVTVSPVPVDPPAGTDD